jgi:hypothetical protein
MPISKQPSRKTVLDVRLGLAIAFGAALMAKPSTHDATAQATILWSADHEEGDMTDWYANGGGNESNSGNAVTGASRDVAHTGLWSAKATITTPPGAGARLFRKARGNPDPGVYTYYSAWFYIPVKMISADFNNIFQFKSIDSGGRSDPFWDFKIRNRSSNGNMYLTLNWWCGLAVEGPHQGESGCRSYQTLKDLPVRQWFHIEAYLRQSATFTGQIIVWQDGVEIFNQNNVKTRYSASANDWSINNYGDHVVPSPFTIYFDDAAISSTRLSASPAPAPPGCHLSSSFWQNTGFTALNGTFTAQFDVTPNGAAIDGVTGLSAGGASAYTDLATIVRFNTAGQIDARNGAAYAALSAVPYVAGTTYRVRMVANVLAHTYSAYVTPNGSTEVPLGINYAFRTEQNTVASLNNLGLISAAGTHNVCNLTVIAPRPATNVRMIR